MRLTCPNCGAQYEVPDDVIPEEGRDVQCSNCGDTWFQQAASQQAAGDAAASAGDAASDASSRTDTAADTATQTAADADAAQPQPTVDPAGHPQAPAPDDVAPDDARPGDAIPESPSDHYESDLSDPQPSEPYAESAPQPDSPAQNNHADVVPDLDDPTPDPDTPMADPAEDAPAPSQTARGLDPALSGILREEAEREASLRAADQNQSQSLETQPNLGLDDLPENEEAQRARQTKDRMARIRGEDPRRLAAESSGLKRGVLPDIEEINSTLRAADSAAPASASGPMLPAPKKSGFTRGFALVILVVLALVMVYSNAPQIAEILPQTDPYLSSYVTWVDQLRLWLDTQVSALQSAQP